MVLHFTKEFRPIIDILKKRKRLDWPTLVRTWNYMWKETITLKGVKKSHVDGLFVIPNKTFSF
jgi:hypothetical protein